PLTPSCASLGIEYSARCGARPGARSLDPARFFVKKRGKKLLNLRALSTPLDAGVGEVPVEIRGEEAEGDYAEHARHDGDALTCQGLEEDADYGAKQRRAGVDVFYEDIGRVAGQHVAQDAAAHAGHYADEDEQERPVLSRLQRRADARHGEGPEAEAVHHQHCKVIKLVPSLEPAAAGHDENRYRRRHGEAGVYGVLEGPRRRAAEDEVAD